MGLIKQRPGITKVDFVRINTAFPQMLATVCEKKCCKLIHVTTDCVFDGLSGNYDEASIHNAIDDYGRSKSLGEPVACRVANFFILSNFSKSSKIFIRRNKF